MILKGSEAEHVICAGIKINGIVLNFCIYLQVQKNRTRKTMQKVIEIFHKHYGYAYLKDLKAQGVHTDTIRKLLAEGKIEKIKPGLSV